MALGVKKALWGLLLLASPSSFSQILPISDLWKCEASDKTYLCTKTFSNQLLLIVVKDADQWDQLENYRQFLSQPRAYDAGKSGRGMSRVLSLAEEKSAGQRWIRSLHVNSEMAGYHTEYRATVGLIGGKQRAVLLTWLVESALYPQEKKGMEAAFAAISVDHLALVAAEVAKTKSPAIRPNFQTYLQSAPIPLVDGNRLAKSYDCFSSSAKLIDQHRCALKFVDRFFDALVLTYPSGVQPLLNAAYYRAAYTQRTKGLLESEGVWGSVELMKMIELSPGATGGVPIFWSHGQPYLPWVRLDGELPPLMQKLVLIHEVGAHLGQVLAMEMVGEKSREPGWHIFTELSAFTLNRDLQEIIPLRVLEYDFSRDPLYAGKRAPSKKALLNSWQVPKSQFGWLMVSGYEKLHLTPEEASAFETRYRSLGRRLTSE